MNGKCLLNIKLEEFGLKNFEHRLIIKLSSFIYKINNDINSPSILKNMIKRNNEYNNNNFKKQTIQLNNHYGEVTFSYFFVNFINNMIFNDLNCNFKHFLNRIIVNVNLLYQKFIDKFHKFKL